MILTGLTAAATILKTLGFTANFLTKLKVAKLEHIEKIAQSDNAAEKQRLEHELAVINAQIEDVQDARRAAAGLPDGLVFSMIVIAGMSALWFAAQILRTMYGYADTTPLNAEIFGLVKVVFGFLFGGSAAVVVSSHFRR